MVKSQYLIGTEQRILKQIANRMLSAFIIENGGISHENDKRKIARKISIV